jgi:excisionase family DNA binding protein
MTEAAQVLGVSRTTLYRLLPRIAHRRIPGAGLTKVLILIPESSLAAFLGRYDYRPESSDAA